MLNKKFGTEGRPIRFIVLLVISIAFIVAALIFITTRQEKSVFDADPIVSYAHGAFFWEDGTSEPDTEYLLDIQNHYILKHQEIISQNGIDEANRIKNVIYDLVRDDVLANGLYLDWLIHQAGNERLSRDSITNNAVRWYYISTIQDDPLPSVVDGYWTKGIDINLVRALQFEGLDIFEAVPAANSDYANQCISAGVPVPERLFDENDENWDSFGFLSAYIAGPQGFEKELWMYLGDDPSGVCLGIRVIKSLDPPKGFFDLICLGVESNNACFFESKGDETNIDGPVDINSIYGGEDAVFGACTECHIGQNSFIVHPQDPAFSEALIAKSIALGNPLSWSGSDYYQPFGVPGWPKNPDPIDLSIIPSVERCSDCHVKSEAGQFPDVSQMDDPTLYKGYCDTVLRGVLGEASVFSATMPLNALSNAGDYDGHKNYLRAMCDKPDEGVLVDNTFDDDPSFVGHPSIITPLYQCAKAVYVIDFIEDAEVELIINDIVVGTVNPAQLSDQIEFSNINQLEEGDIVQTRQRVNGTWSERSKPVVVANYKDDYPDGLPTPTIDPSTIYACSSVLAVRYDIPGFGVEVWVNDANPVASLTFAGHLAVTPGKTPFEFEDEFTAQVSACGDVSPVSDVVKAQRPSSDILTDAQINPLSFYESQEFIYIGNLTHGSSSEILESGAGSLASFSTPLSWNISRIDNPLALSDQLVVSQELCGFSSQPPFSQSPTVLNCSALPAPAIKDPLPSEDFVSVLQPLLGARVRIYDESGNELGDGTGSVIVLNRTLNDGEFVTVVQQLGDCISSQGYQIEV